MRGRPSVRFKRSCSLALTPRALWYYNIIIFSLKTIRSYYYIKRPLPRELQCVMPRASHGVVYYCNRMKSIAKNTTIWKHNNILLLHTTWYYIILLSCNSILICYYVVRCDVTGESRIIILIIPACVVRCPWCITQTFDIGIVNLCLAILILFDDLWY